MFVPGLKRGCWVEPTTAWGVAMLHMAGYELLLVAAVGIAVLGIDDLLFDGLWLAQRRSPALPASLRPAEGMLAVFVPAWREAEVLPATIRRMLAQWRGEDVRIYIGCYPNDAATLFSVTPLVAAHPALRLVIAPHNGPTSKADNLNQMWHALGADRRSLGLTIAGVVLHDAEDFVHSEELALYRRHLPTAALVQIPVEPLLGTGDPMVAAHYADEFAEAHSKEMPLRSGMRAALPAAGVGCAFSLRALTLLALERPAGPFNADSLTEDYEAGLVLGALQLPCRFVAARGADGRRIATRSAFPASLEAAVRQKSRWIAGIALAGWDRLDWSGAPQPRPSGRAKSRTLSLITRWMLWRDRRAALSALIILCAYAALLCAGVDRLAGMMGWWVVPPLGGALQYLLLFNAALLVWRLLIRARFVAAIYGWRQALASVPRAFIGNIIHMLAARRAFAVYIRQVVRRELVWDKTDHRPLATGPAWAGR
jgi:bacteriophage N4 adsorption protein B